VDEHTQELKHTQADEQTQEDKYTKNLFKSENTHIWVNTNRRTNTTMWMNIQNVEVIIPLSLTYYHDCTCVARPLQSKPVPPHLQILPVQQASTAMQSG